MSKWRCTAINHNIPDIQPPAVLSILKLNSIKEGCSAIDTGPFRVGIRVHKCKLCLVWHWQKKRYYQVIDRVRFQSSAWALCPQCGKKTWRLFTVKGDGPFVCRCCSGIAGYVYWHQPGQTRQPKTDYKWFMWLQRKAEKILKKGVQVNVKGSRYTK